MVLFHIIALILTAGAVVYSDEQGLMWILGKKQTLSVKRVEVLHSSVSLGLASILLTGGLMVLPALSYYLSNPVFRVKMLFVAALIVNAFFIGRLSHLATTRTFASLSTKERIPLFVSGVVSVIGWGGALIAGLLLGG